MYESAPMRMTRKQCVEIELRAAELADDAPRGPLGNDHYTMAERGGWAMHYWLTTSRKGSRDWHGEVARAPTTPGELAGWLAREIYLGRWE
jgi:hypothetical protein